MSNIEFLQLSSLEKVFMSKRPEVGEFKSISVLKNESFSYQIAYFKKTQNKCPVKITVSSPLSEYITVYRVQNVPVQLPLWSENSDDDYIMREPGLAPDVLIPVDTEKNQLMAERWESFWIKTKLCGEVSAGNYDISITFEYEENGEKESVTKNINVEIINALLPEQSLIYTRWFHCDCIASHFNVPVFSEEHWGYIEKFIKSAVSCGINMILTPIFTPPLDTEVGGERPTVQLVKVKKSGGSYSFDFSLLDRWVDMCRSCGIKYFEMAHLFTQWGAKFTPKIIAEVEEKEKRIFGWDVPSDSEEYKAFLTAFLPKLDAYLKDKGIAGVTYFHISDEPEGDEAKRNYLEAKKLVKSLLPGYKIMDAISDVEYYKEGVAEIPVCANDHIKPFLCEDIPERWTYYCTAQTKGVSNQFISMPSYRNRVIADQLFKYDIKGFLHWGFNFYYSQYSRYEINPYIITDADGAFQSGDAFCVYPYKDGVVRSMRADVFENALSDLRAMELLASKIGHDRVVQLLEEEAGMSIEFDKYPCSAEYIMHRRELINSKVKELV